MLSIRKAWRKETVGSAREELTVSEQGRKETQKTEGREGGPSEATNLRKGKFSF